MTAYGGPPLAFGAPFAAAAAETPLAARMAARWRDVAAHLALVAAVAFTLLWNSPSLTLMLGGAVAMPAYLWLALREARRSPLMLTPLSFYFIWYSVALGASAIWMGNYVRGGEWAMFSVALISPRDTAVAYVEFMLGSAMLHAGIQIFRPTRPVAHAQTRPPRPEALLRAIAVLYMLGLLTLWRPNTVAALGAPGRVLQWAGYGALAVFALQPPARMGLSRTAFVALLTVGTAVLAAVSLMAFSKAYLMYALVPVGWLFLIEARLRRWIPLLIGGLGLLYLGVVAPVITVARFTPLEPGESAVERLSTTFARYLDNIRNGRGEFSEITLGDVGEGMLSRTFDTLPLAFFQEDVRANGFQGGATLIDGAYAFVPRVLWPGKPSVTRGGWFAYYIGFAESPETSTTALGVTAPGEFYWNFGLIGLVVGMFVVGCMLGALWRIAGLDPLDQPTRMLLYVMIMLNTPNMAEAVTVLVFIVSAYVTFKAAFFAQALLTANSKIPDVDFATRTRNGPVLPDHR